MEVVLSGDVAHIFYALEKVRGLFGLCGFEGLNNDSFRSYYYTPNATPPYCAHFEVTGNGEAKKFFAAAEELGGVSPVCPNLEAHRKALEKS